MPIFDWTKVPSADQCADSQWLTLYAVNTSLGYVCGIKARECRYCNLVRGANEKGEGVEYYFCNKKGTLKRILQTA